MKPDQIDVLRRLALSDERTMTHVMTGGVHEFHTLDSRTVALLRIAALVGVMPDVASYKSAMDKAHAAGVEDEDIFGAVMVVAPIVGSARLSSELPHLMAALDLEVIED
jgi:alkylhydroperoxidase/carboxymuconolactone decarboxylase family protein YurZ